jgi:hypothetical protein
VWLAAQISLEPTAADFWANLAFPDLIEVGPTPRCVRRLMRYVSGSAAIRARPWSYCC